MKQLKLFDQSDPTKNLLPFDGTVNYYGAIFDENESLANFDEFYNTIPWQNDEVILFGKKIITARKMAWFSDLGNSYTYSNSTKQGHIFTTKLLAIKTKIEQLTAEKYNACLLNLYQNGTEGMGWHADNETEILEQSAIASISFGMARLFSLKHNSTKNKLDIILENGSMLIMKDETQQNWKHSLPKSTKINGPRINLTFRQMK